MDLIIGIAIGVILTLVVLNILAKLVDEIRNKQLDKKLEEGLQKLREVVIPSRIEVVNGMLFLYNKENGEFIAQGKNFIELNDNAKARYPEKLFNVPQDEIDAVTKGISIKV
jgi:predicted RND superfamily exporter protein